MIERRHHQPAMPPVELDRETEDRVRIRVWVAQEHVSGFGRDGVSLRPIVIDDLVPGLQASPKLTSDGVGRGDAIAVGIHEVYPSGLVACRPAGSLRVRHVTASASGGLLGSRPMKRRTYQISGMRMKASCEMTLPYTAPETPIRWTR